MGIRNQILWLEFNENPMEVLAQEGERTLAGLPYCIFERLGEIPYQRHQWIRCPSLSRDKSLRGMSKEFLSTLGIEEPIGED